MHGVLSEPLSVNSGTDPERWRGPEAIEECPSTNVGSLSSRHPAVESTRNQKIPSSCSILSLLKCALSAAVSWQRAVFGATDDTELSIWGFLISQDGSASKCSSNSFFSTKQETGRKKRGLYFFNYHANETNTTKVDRPHRNPTETFSITENISYETLEQNPAWAYMHFWKTASSIYACLHGSQLELYLPGTQSESLCDKS